VLRDDRPGDNAAGRFPLGPADIELNFSKLTFSKLRHHLSDLNAVITKEVVANLGGYFLPAMRVVAGSSSNPGYGGTI
jgi:hypothetical protein